MPISLYLFQKKLFFSFRDLDLDCQAIAKSRTAAFHGILIQPVKDLLAITMVTHDIGLTQYRQVAAYCRLGEIHFAYNLID